MASDETAVSIENEPTGPLEENLGHIPRRHGHPQISPMITILFFLIVVVQLSGATNAHQPIEQQQSLDLVFDDGVDGAFNESVPSTHLDTSDDLLKSPTRLTLASTTNGIIYI